MTTTPSQPYVIAGGLTIPQVANTLNLSTTTVRRYIRQGRIQAQLTTGKFGPEYTITHIPDDLLPHPPSEAIAQTLGYQSLMAEIGRLNQEVGYWRSQYEAAASQIKLLTTPKLPWIKRLIQRLPK